MTARTASLMTAAAALSLLAGGAWAQCATFQKLNKVSATANDRYAISVALGQGPTSPLVIIGDPGYDGPAGADVGSFSVWAKGGAGWSSVGGSFNGGATTQAGDHMGEAVDMADPFVICGVPDNQNGQGKARIYERTSGYNWTLKSEVFAYNANSTDRSGSAVAISTYGGGWAVMGSPNHDFHGLSDPGAAFFYTRNANGTWSPAFQVWGADFNGQNFERRGTSVAMSKSSRYAVVGGPGGKANGQPDQSGVAYVVSRLDNGLVGSPQVLSPAGAGAELNAHYGAAVAVEGDLIVVGAPDDDITLLENFPNGGRTDCGRIYIYERSGFNWNLVAQRTASDPLTGMKFGSQLATDGNRILVTAGGNNTVYVFEKLGGVWTQTNRIADPDNPGTFGNSLSIMGGHLAIGDAGDDEGAITDRGASYMFELNANQPSDVCSNAQPMPLTEFSGCSSYASPSAPANATTCGTGGSQGNDVWYAFTPNCTGNAIIDTWGSAFDTVLSVHTGCPTALGSSTLVCNDDANFPAPNNRASLVTFNFSAGETYYVRIAGYNGASGAFNVRPSFYYSYTNDTCSGAIPLAPGSYTFGNCGAHTENTSVICPSDGFVSRNDLWYKFTPSTSGVHTFNTCGSPIDTVMALYSGCPSQGGQSIACDDDYGGGCANALNAGFVAPLTAGQTYYLSVGNFGEGTTGSFNLNILEPAPACDPDMNQDGNADQDDVTYLINAIGGGGNPNNIDLDFNQDGNADQDDVTALVNVVAGGACP
jgi:hypothetical protein